MKLCVFAFGKLKTPGLRDTADHYKRLIRPWIVLDEIELKPLPVPEKSPALRTQIQEKEGKILLERIKNETRTGRTLIFLLDETGKEKTSQQWAQDLRALEFDGVTNLVFCIGSSLGFSQEIRQLSRGSLSLGLHTLPHELARVVLMEQLYRAYSILKGHPYHNEGA